MAQSAHTHSAHTISILFVHSSIHSELNCGICLCFCRCSYRLFGLCCDVYANILLWVSDLICPEYTSRVFSFFIRFISFHFISVLSVLYFNFMCFFFLSSPSLWSWRVFIFSHSLFFLLFVIFFHEWCI